VHGAPELSGMTPVYPVVLGRPDTIKDIAVQQVSATQTAFEDAPVSIQADVSTAGYSGQNIVGQMLDQSGKVVAEQSLRSRSDNDHLAFRFQLRPERPGGSFYRFRAGIRNELPDASLIAVSAPAPATS